MLRGPAWSGSLQQDLIEKLWVAILTCEEERPKPPEGGASTEKEVSGESSSDDSEDSEDSDSESDTDGDIDLSELGGGLPLVDRYDLFSMAKVRQNQQSLPKTGNSAGVSTGVGDLQGTNTEKADARTPPDDKPSVEETPRGENKDTVMTPANSSAACDTPSFSQSGAKPKITHMQATQPPPEGRRPRPNTLNFAKTSSKSRIPQLSPVSPQAVSRTQIRRPQWRGNVSRPIRRASCPGQRSPGRANQGKTSRIPVSPLSQSKALHLQDRAHLLDVVPRRRMSDPRQTRDHKNIKSNPVIWRRRAVTPETARPYPLHRPNAKKETRDDAKSRRYTQMQYYRGNSSRWSAHRAETEVNKTDKCAGSITSRSRRDSRDDRTTKNNTGRWRQMSTDKREKPKSPIRPVARSASMGCNRARSQPRSLLSNVSATKSITNVSGTKSTMNVSGTKSTTNVSTTKSTTNVSAINSEKNVSVTKSRERLSRKENKTLPGRRVAGEGMSSENRPNDKENQGKITRTEENKSGDNDDAVQENVQCGVDKENNEVSLKEENAGVAAEASENEFKETTASLYGSEVETRRLEDCLKEAILGVLQGLPEGWILVPEHTSELFSSLTSVVDSFPRPDQARARVLEAIVDAHAQRPCGKGEIAALNNAHLLLYVGLKLCCLNAETAVTSKEEEKEAIPCHQPKNKEGNHQKSPKVTDSGKDPSVQQVVNERNEMVNASEDDASIQKWDSSDGQGKISTEKNLLNVLKTNKNDVSAGSNGTVEQGGIALKILREILKCEGSFDRLTMCLLLGSRAPGRGSGWYCETEEESEKVRDLRFVLNHLKHIDGCRVSEVVSAPLWSCGSSPVVLAALAESPKLVLALLQYGAGGSAANHYLYSRCYTNGVYLAIAYLVRKLESQFKDSSTNMIPGDPDENQPNEEGADNEHNENGQVQLAVGPGNKGVLRNEEEAKKNDLLRLAGHTPTAACLRYLLRAVPRVPLKFLRDQLGGCARECGRDVAYLLPHPCCLQPPALLHLSRAACRQHLRIYDLLPQIIDVLDIPETLKNYLNLLRD